LGENAGLDPIDILSELRARHEKGEKWAGVTEAATMILRIDDVIASAKMKTPPMPPGGPGGGYGGMPPGGMPPGY